MAIDDGGYIWIFSNAHGTGRPAYIWKSEKPYEIDRFTKIIETNFSYGHPLFTPAKGSCPSTRSTAMEDAASVLVNQPRRHEMERVHHCLRASIWGTPSGDRRLLVIESSPCSTIIPGLSV